MVVNMGNTRNALSADQDKSVICGLFFRNRISLKLRENFLYLYKYKKNTVSCDNCSDIAHKYYVNLLDDWDKS